MQMEIPSDALFNNVSNSSYFACILGLIRRTLYLTKTFQKNLVKTQVHKNKSLISSCSLFNNVSNSSYFSCILDLYKSNIVIKPLQKNLVKTQVHKDKNASLVSFQ